MSDTSIRAVAPEEMSEETLQEIFDVWIEVKDPPASGSTHTFLTVMNRCLSMGKIFPILLALGSAFTKSQRFLNSTRRVDRLEEEP